MDSLLGRAFRTTTQSPTLQGQGQALAGSPVQGSIGACDQGQRAPHDLRALHSLQDLLQSRLHGWHALCPGLICSQRDVSC